MIEPKALIDARAWGYCEVLTPMCSHKAVSLYTRTRPETITAACDALVICPECDRWLRQTELARLVDEGFVVPEGENPAAVPVKRRGHWCVLAVTGGVTRLTRERGRWIVAPGQCPSWLSPGAWAVRFPVDVTDVLKIRRACARAA